MSLADKLEGLGEKATAGPWTWTDDNGPEFPKQWRIVPGVLLADGASGTPGGDEIDRANAALIVELRNALPTIITALRSRPTVEEVARALGDPELFVGPPIKSPQLAFEAACVALSLFGEEGK